MPQSFRRPGRSDEPLLQRLDRAAGVINPFLTIIAIGLALLDAVCVIGLLDTGNLRTNPGGSAISAPATGVVASQLPN
jgi:hypothetical protein